MVIHPAYKTPKLGWDLMSSCCCSVAVTLQDPLKPDGFTFMHLSVFSQASKPFSWNEDEPAVTKVSAAVTPDACFARVSNAVDGFMRKNAVGAEEE
ncbi:hypothetical protein WJX79_001393 [Trebouxia sp. C0005]